MAGSTFDIGVILRCIDKFSTPMNKFQRSMASAGKKMTDVGKSASLKLTLPIVGFGAFGIKSAIDVESAFTGIQKTVNATAPELEDLRKKFEALSLKVPLPIDELMGIGEAAGQLGIETKNIVSFSKVMADLGATTDLASREAAMQLSRFANIVGMSQGDFDRLGSVIVDLGNNMATTESQITELGMRLAGAGKGVGMNTPQIMAFAAALSSLGINAEAGGTAFSRVMQKIDLEIGTGSKKLKSFAKVSGMSVGEFEKSWKEDAGGTIIHFIKGLNQAQKQGIKINQGLKELGFADVRIMDTVKRSLGNPSLLIKAQKISAKAWKQNSALQKEADLRYKTTAAQLQLFKNNLVLLGNAFGKVMVPVLKTLMKMLNPVIDYLKTLPSPVKKIILVVLALAAAIGPLLIGLGLITTAMGVLMAVSWPIVGIVLAITAAIAGLTAGVIWLYRNWDKIITYLSDSWEKFYNFLITPIDLNTIKNLFAKLTEYIPDWLLTALDWVGIDVPVSVTNSPAGGDSSKTEVVVKVQAEGGATSKIDKTTSTGQANVNVENISDVGPTTLAYGMP